MPSHARRHDGNRYAEGVSRDGGDQDPGADREDARGRAGRRGDPRGDAGRPRCPAPRPRTWTRSPRKVIADHGAKPNFLGYGGFPGNICTSVNDVVVHGIPDRATVLKDGDLISIDAGAIVDGWHGDAAFTAFVGTGHAPELVELSRVTEESMWAGIAAVPQGQPAGGHLPGDRELHPPPAAPGLRQVRHRRGLRRPRHRHRDAHGPAPAELRRAASAAAASSWCPASAWRSSRW